MLILATCYSSMQSYLKSILFEECYSMLNFYIKNHDPYGSLTKNCQKLDKNGIVSAFSVFVVCRSTVSTFRRETMQGVSVFVSEGLYLHIYFLIFQ